MSRLCDVDTGRHDNDDVCLYTVARATLQQQQQQQLWTAVRLNTLSLILARQPSPPACYSD